jgi:hypothetical protein
VFVPLVPAAQNLGVGLRRPYRGQVFGSKLGAMSRIAPPQPNEAMALIDPRFFSAAPTANNKINLLVPSYLGIFLDVDLRFKIRIGPFLVGF